MRLGVLDVGSNTVHLIVVDAHRGARPIPMSSDKSVLRLMRYLEPDGAISDEGVAAIISAVGDAAAIARESGLDEFLAVRDLGHPRGRQRRRGARPRRPRDRRRTPGASRRRRGEPDLPRRAALVRLVGREHPALRHRRRLARAHAGHRRGARRRTLGAARRGSLDRRVPARRSALRSAGGTLAGARARAARTARSTRSATCRRPTTSSAPRRPSARSRASRAMSPKASARANATC